MPTSYLNVSSAADLSADIKAIDLASTGTGTDCGDRSTFLSDGAASGGGANTTFTSAVTGDKLTLDGVTLAQLGNMSADFKFV
jgi:hypothetical protein